MFQALDIILFICHYSHEIKPVKRTGCHEVPLHPFVEKGCTEQDAAGIEQGFQVLKDDSLGLHRDWQAV